MVVAKKIFRLLFSNSKIAKLVLKPLLKLDNFIYLLIGHYAPLASKTGHPKHDIIKYIDWFLDKIEKDMTLIDVGSNTGQMTKRISEKAKMTYGVEIDSKLHKIAIKQKRENLEFINSDATKFDYSKLKPIDCITLSNVLEHIDDRTSFLKSLNDNVKWKKNPRYLIRVPMINRHWVVILKKQMGVDYRLDKTHFIEYTKETFYEEMEISSLKVISFEVKWGEIYAECIR
jgi:predicted RNA methylase